MGQEQAEPLNKPISGESAFPRNFFAGILLDNKWFTLHVVLDHWFLHTRQPAMQAY